MTQGNTEEKGNGKNTNKGVSSRIEEKFFENQDVPMWASTKVASKVLGITPNALRIRKCRGQIEFKYFGNQLRFNLTYLQSLLRDSRSSTERIK